MDRLVVMVDAGYLLHQALEILSQRQGKLRAELHLVDPAVMIRSLVQASRDLLDAGSRELLRVYWYDGVLASGATADQWRIMGLPDVVFRAGTVNKRGQQKGVDSLIVTDLIELATNHAIADAVLVTGDGDLAVGVQIAQMRGVRIGVLGVADLSQKIGHNQSPEVTNRADRVGRWERGDLEPHFLYQPPPPVLPSGPTPTPPERTETPHAPTPTPSDIEQRVRAAVRTFIRGNQALKETIDPVTRVIKSETDAALMYQVYQALGRKLSPDERRLLRQIYRDELGA